MGGLTPVLTLPSGLTVPAHLVNQSPTVSHMPPYLFQPPTHQTISKYSLLIYKRRITHLQSNCEE